MGLYSSLYICLS